MTQYWGGGHKTLFLTNFFKFSKYWGGDTRSPPPPLLRRPCVISDGNPRSFSFDLCRENNVEYWNLTVLTQSANLTLLGKEKLYKLTLLESGLLHT